MELTHDLAYFVMMMMMMMMMMMIMMMCDNTWKRNAPVMT